MALSIADKWYERCKIDDQITLLWEPHVALVNRCNIWHVPGRDRDLVIDFGMGLCSLKEEIKDLLGKPVIAVATHSHNDHTGCFHEFDVRAAHKAEAANFCSDALTSLRVDHVSQEEQAYLERVGYGLKGEHMIAALPHAGFNPDSWRQTPAAPTWLIDEGDVLDLGDRRFDVLHLPGHSPGGIGLWEAEIGTLFSGDTVYDGPLLDEFPDANIDDYIASMERLRRLPVSVVHGGHDGSFDGKHLHQIIDTYLRKKG